MELLKELPQPGEIWTDRSYVNPIKNKQNRQICVTIISVTPDDNEVTFVTHDSFIPVLTKLDYWIKYHHKYDSEIDSDAVYNPEQAEKQAEYYKDKCNWRKRK